MSSNSSIDVDLAAEISEAERASIVNRVRQRPFIAGTAGVCIDCEEERPRLVNGRCAFCRDRRGQK